MMNDGGEWRTWRVTVDGGGETWPMLADMVGHRIDELRPGDVLHVISREPTTWCDIAEYFHVAARGTGGALQGTITSTGQGSESAAHVELAFTQANPFSPVVFSGIYHCS